MIDINDPMVQEFLVESDEHLSTFESNLLEFENNYNKQIINILFRSIHTIKGCCGFFGFETLGKVLHEAETILDKMRSEKLTPDKLIVDTLLEANDVIKNLFADLENSENYNIESIISKLSSIYDNEAGGATGDLSKYSDIILESLKEDNFVYYLTFNSNEDALVTINNFDTLGKVEKIDNGIEGTESPILFFSVLEKDILEATINIEPKLFIQIEDIKSIGNVADQGNTTKRQSSTSKTESQTLSITKNTPASSQQSSIRINIELLDQLIRKAGELVLVRNQFMVNYDKEDDAMRKIAHDFNFVASSLQENIMKMRMQPIGNVFRKFTRLVRDLGSQLGKEIEIKMTGEDVELDKTIIESLGDPLTHIIRNSCDHGLETPDERIRSNKDKACKIHLKAWHEGGKVQVAIEDDGRGINIQKVAEKAISKELITEDEIDRLSHDELAMLVTMPGFSTAEEVSELSGRGVGMDVVKTSVEKLGGSLNIKSVTGKGCTIHIELPLTLAIIPALLIVSGKQKYALPQVEIEELLCLYPRDGEKLGIANDQEIYRLRDEFLPVIRLNEILNSEFPLADKFKSDVMKKYHSNESSEPEEIIIVVVKTGNKKFGIVIDDILNSEEIVIKPLHSALVNIPCASGATVLGDGNVALILNTESLAEFAQIEFPKVNHLEKEDTTAVDNSTKVFCFDSGGCNFAIELEKIKRIVGLDSNRFQSIGKEQYAIVDGISTRVILPSRILHINDKLSKDEVFMILPKGSDTAFGIIAENLKDTVNVTTITNDPFSSIERQTITVNDEVHILLSFQQIEELMKCLPNPFDKSQGDDIPSTDIHLLSDNHLTGTRY